LLAIGLAELYPERTVAQIARASRISRYTAERALEAAGVQVRSGNESRERNKRIDWGSAGLGRRNDVVIAADLGVSVSVVRYHRVKRNIAAATKNVRVD